MTAARRRLLGQHEPAVRTTVADRARAAGGLRGRYHLRVRVDGSATSLDDIVSALRRNEVRVGSVRRRRTAGPDTWVLVTEPCREADLLSAVDSLSALPSVGDVPRFLRILDSDGQEVVDGQGSTADR